jgi:adenosylmethionine-8-amino-7-oxononanoate aminotransferase
MVSAAYVPRVVASALTAQGDRLSKLRSGGQPSTANCQLGAASVSWVERDARVVWHGFTQMDCYVDNAPVIVERAEGRELIDVNGKRYLDAISSLWVTTLGHCIPELDQAVREQLDRVAHTTLLGNGNRIVVEFAEALTRVVPLDRPHVLFAADGASAVEQALKIAFQYWANLGVRGKHTYLAFGDAYHGDTVGGLLPRWFVNTRST